MPLHPMTRHMSGRVTYGLPTLKHLLFDFGDSLGRIEVLGTGLGAVHDGVTAVKSERVFQRVEPFTCGFIA